jgi:plasmid maintenance system antidote protein VapI
MVPENCIPTHPRVIIEQKFLDSLGITQVALAAHLGVSV